MNAVNVRRMIFRSNQGDMRRDVEPLALLGREFAGSAALFDLPQPRESRRTHEAFDIFVAGETLGLVERQGTVAHDRHVAAQDVEQLRQFVDAVFAQETAQPRDAGIVFDLDEGVFLLGAHDLLVLLFGDCEIVGEKHAALHVGEQLLHLLLVERYFRGAGAFLGLRRVLIQGAQLLEPPVGVGAHRAEFQEVEDAVVTAHAFRAVDDRSRAVEFDRHGHGEQQRRERDDRPERCGDVEGPFPERHAKDLHLLVHVYDGPVGEGVVGHEPQRAPEILDGHVARHGAVDSGAQVIAAFPVAEIARRDQDDARFGEPRAQEADVVAIGSRVALFVENAGVFGAEGRERPHRGGDVSGDVHLPAGEFRETGRAVSFAFDIDDGVFQSMIFLMRILSSSGLKGLTM